MHNVKCQVLRSVSSWSAGFLEADTVEQSIHEAYIHAISNAQRYFFYSTNSVSPDFIYISFCYLIFILQVYLYREPVFYNSRECRKHISEKSNWRNLIEKDTKSSQGRFSVSSFCCYATVAWI